MNKTPLFDFHVSHGAKMVDFAGWQMPLLYTGIVEEHLHTRQAASLFDVSHMGRIEFRGPQAMEMLQRICTRQLADMQPGQSRYSHICNEEGTILDDVIVSRYSEHWLMVCNAGNRERVLQWLGSHADGSDVEIRDVTFATMMIALQGPAAAPLLSRKLPLPVVDLKRYRFLNGSLLGTPYTIFRSGYTGEDGFEIIVPAEIAPLLSGYFSQIAAENVIVAGLAARDTLRLEAGMPLYGHELHEKIDPISAGQSWCVDLNKEFVGVQALRELVALGINRTLVGLELEGRRIARQHAEVLSGEKKVGEVTSGTFAPSLQKSIAMAYVRADMAQPGASLSVQLAGGPVNARVARLPFYRRPQ